MICYTTLDGFVIERVFRGNCATAETCRKRLASARPEARDWFVSSNQLAAKSLAVLSVISNEHNWRILQSEEMFSEWAKNKVR